jgi:eukaryotic-like serine/threonine-protein kinase
MIEAGAPPAVPGLVLERRLGVGGHGEVWRALDLGGGGAVAVQIGAPAGRAGTVAREAARLRRIDHGNVARLRSVIDLPPGRRAVVLDLVPGGDLATLVVRRGALPTGEVVAVAIALARALEHVHGLGLVHGRLSARDVLFDADGRPVLTGVGIPSLLAGRSASGLPAYPAPADDVRGLGEVLRLALTGGRPDTAVPGPLAGLVALCMARDPAARPSPPEVSTMATARHC